MNIAIQPLIGSLRHQQSYHRTVKKNATSIIRQFSSLSRASSKRATIVPRSNIGIMSTSPSPIIVTNTKNKRNFSDLTTTIESLTASFVNLHNNLGLPWWALIPLTTIVFRSTITLPLAILNRKRMVKQQQLRPILDAMYPILKFNLMSKMMLRNRATAMPITPNSTDNNTNSNSSTKDPLVVATNDPMAALTYEQVVLLSAKEKRNRQKKLYKENHCQAWKNFTLPLLQIPLWIVLSLSMRNLSGWNSFLISSTTDKVEPTLLNEGLFWFTDLSHADPYGVLPVMLGLASLTNIELLARYNPSKFHSSSFVKDTFSNRLTVFDSILNISRLSVIFLMGISSQAPGILVLYWISSNVFSLCQNVVFQYLWPLKENFYGAGSPEHFMINEKNIVKQTGTNAVSPYVETASTRSVAENVNTAAAADAAAKVSDASKAVEKRDTKQLDDLLQLELNQTSQRNL